MVAGGFKAATTDPGKVRSWWLGWPDANVGIATGASGLTVLDIDHGINDRLDVDAFCDHYGVPETYTVRTGRRPEFGVQMYFSGEGLKSIAWEEGRCSGDVRGATGYVMAEGSYHPSGAFYEALVEAPIAEVPPFVKMLRPRQITGTTGAANPAVTDDGNSPITAARNVTMISILGRKRAEGYDDDRLREFAIDVNASRVVPPLGEEELERLITNACKYPVPEPEPEVLIGGKPAEKPKVLLPKDWRENYHTFEEMRDVPPPEFLIEGFLLRDSITALAAPVAQRKSIIALNVAHSLCTGEPLFDYFKLTRSPSRVLYLCPEMGLQSFTDRLKKIGLLEYVGKTLFCRTMSHKGGKLELEALCPEELSGAVVIIDTAVRYLKGDENSSEHMREFAAAIFTMKEHADAVLLLHHSSKGAKGSVELNLENSMRGSGELGAFVTSCWATRLKDPENPHQSASYIVNVKQRDFESDAFEAVSGPDFRMRISAPPGEAVLNLQNTPDRDGKATEAEDFIRDNPDMPVRKLVSALSELGIKRGRTWVAKKKTELSGTGVSLKSG